MIIRGITIRSKLILVTVLTVGIMVVLLLVTMDASRRLSLSRELLMENSAIMSQMRRLEYSFYSLVREETPPLHAICIQNARLTFYYS